MKKIAIVVMLITLVVALTACNSTENRTTKADDTEGAILVEESETEHIITEDIITETIICEEIDFKPIETKTITCEIVK